MFFTLLLPNLLLFGVVFLVPWVVALFDILRAPDLTSDMRIVWALVLIFAWPVGLIAWMVLRGRHRWRQFAIGLIVSVMGLIAVVTVLEAIALSARTATPQPVLPAPSGPPSAP